MVIKLQLKIGILQLKIVLRENVGSSFKVCEFFLVKDFASSVQTVLMFLE